MLKKLDINKENLDIIKMMKIDNALITTGSLSKHNTMTIGWGSIGVLWRLPVFTAYVKPTRYTFDFMEQNEYFTITTFDQTINSKIMQICGTKSGRDIDKDQLCAITPIEIENSISYEEANLIIICKKIYSDQFKEDHFIDQDLLRIYPDHEYHHFYIGQIIGLYCNKIN